MAPNLKLNNGDFPPGDPAQPRADFRSEDDTVTAIVSLPLPPRVTGRPLVDSRRNRHTWLPDAAAGVFAPGWDTSFDITESVRHLAAYGLGSPFPEDAKLCATLSTFWPAAAPDAGRSFSLAFPTVSPLTDEELGADGGVPWDGVLGPRVVMVGGRATAEYASFDHVDYVELALGRRFSLSLTARIDTAEYVARVVAMARAYRAVGVRSVDQKEGWNLISFRKVDRGDSDVEEAENKTGERLQGQIFVFDLYQPDSRPSAPAQSAEPGAGWRSTVAMRDRRLVLVAGTPNALVKSGTTWRVRNV